MEALLASPMNGIHPETKVIRRTAGNVMRELKHACSYHFDQEKTRRRALEISQTAEAKAVRTDRGNVNDPRATLQGSRTSPGTRSPLPLLVLP